MMSGDAGRRTFLGPIYITFRPLDFAGLTAKNVTVGHSCRSASTIHVVAPPPFSSIKNWTGSEKVPRFVSSSVPCSVCQKEKMAVAREVHHFSCMARPMPANVPKFGP